jgi:hypothetical protein
MGCLGYNWKVALNIPQESPPNSSQIINHQNTHHPSSIIILFIPFFMAFSWHFHGISPCFAPFVGWFSMAKVRDSDLAAAWAKDHRQPTPLGLAWSVWKSGAKDFVADQNLMATSAKKNRWDG